MIPGPELQKYEERYQVNSVRSKSDFFVSVQALRGIAALLVVLLHDSEVMAARAGNPTLLFTAGGSGVDIFFAISGFVMVTVTEPVWGRGGIAWTFSSAD